MSYHAATPIQEEAIPLILSGVDLLAAAQTGSGKTAAFVLPLLQRLSSKGRESGLTEVLVLTPTRELAAQVAEAVESYGQGLVSPLSCVAIFGGASIAAQVDRALAGADILVATPGRLLDLVERQVVDLSQVRTLVLDEADRMLALGFADELEAILRLLPSERQNLLFSATFPQAVASMAHALLKDPARVELASAAQPVEGIVQRAIEVERDSRTALLRHLIATEGWDRILVFVGSKRRASNVASKLEKHGLRAAVLHGDLKQEQRTAALQRFKAGKMQVLMATDLAARGINIEDLPCVVNYDIPRSAADYVHRVGRTGRAGKGGVAVSFVTQEELRSFELIAKRAGLSIERERMAGFEPKAWNPEAVPVSKAPVKGKRKSKKDKLREAAAKEKLGEVSEEAAGPWKVAKERSSDAEATGEAKPVARSADPWQRAAQKRQRGS